MENQEPQTTNPIRESLEKKGWTFDVTSFGDGWSYLISGTHPTIGMIFTGDRTGEMSAWQEAHDRIGVLDGTGYVFGAKPKEPPKREPQLSEDQASEMSVAADTRQLGGIAVQQHYEGLIDDGTLMVGSKVKLILEHLLDDTLFMHGNAEVREEKIRNIAKTHGIELE